MIGLVIAAHGDLAKGYLHAAEMIVGKQESVAVVALREGISPNQLREMMKEKIEEVNQGKGVLILADLFGGTPGNIALEFTVDDNICVIAGINLGLVLESTQMRTLELSLSDMADQLVELGKSGVKKLKLKATS